MLNLLLVDHETTLWKTPLVLSLLEMERSVMYIRKELSQQYPSSVVRNRYIKQRRFFKASGDRCWRCLCHLCCHDLNVDLGLANFNVI